MTPLADKLLPHVLHVVVLVVIGLCLWKSGLLS